MKKEKDQKHTTGFFLKDDVLHLEDNLLKGNVPELYNQLFSSKYSKELSAINYINGSKVKDIDSAGVALLDEIFEFNKTDAFFSDFLRFFSSNNITKINTFTTNSLGEAVQVTGVSFLESIGDFFFRYIHKVFEMMVLTSDIFYWSVVALWNRRGQRKGSLTQQGVLIGVDALPIVSLLSFIIGLILSLQSAVQLRQFGADQFLANLLAVSLVREMSPLITAIIIAGRSGSAIASEIATMKVTEELDALKMMALNPIRYVVVPKFHAVTICMSLLVMFSIIVGILGGLIIAVTVLDLSPTAFLKTCIDVVSFKDLFITMIKSTVFAWQIVIIGSHYGFQVTGGAEGVGKATTQAVVASIFGVIIMDAIFSLIYLI